MAHEKNSYAAFPRPHADRLFNAPERQANPFPIQVIKIDWEGLIANRSVLLASLNHMPTYLLYPEVQTLLKQEAHPTNRLIMDLMWTTGACISEVLALTPGSFIDDGVGVGVILKTLKQGAGRPTKSQQAKSRKRYIPIKDIQVIDQLNCYLREHPRRKDQRLFTMCRQTINRHIHALVERVGGSPFQISARTFRHSFAIHLILHGRPLKYVSQLLGHKSIESTQIYTNVLVFDGRHFLDGVNFH